MTVASDNEFPKIILVEGAAPATPDAGEVKLYAKTDGLVYSKDDAGAEIGPFGPGGGGVTVEDEGTPLSTTADTLDFVGAGVTASGTGTTKTITIPGGSGGVSWTQDVNESGTSFANFTATGGTWASDGTTINQTDTSGSTAMAKFNTGLAQGYGVIIEAEMQFPTAGQGGGGNIYGAVVVASNGSSTGYALILDVASDLVRIHTWNVAEIRQIALTINLDTWYKVRLVFASGMFSYYVGGTLLGSTLWQVSHAAADFVCIGTYAASVKYRNIKAWTLTGGAPA